MPGPAPREWLCLQPAGTVVVIARLGSGRATPARKGTYRITQGGRGAYGLGLRSCAWPRSAPIPHEAAFLLLLHLACLLYRPVAAYSTPPLAPTCTLRPIIHPPSTRHQAPSNVRPRPRPPYRACPACAVFRGVRPALSWFVGELEMDVPSAKISALRAPRSQNHPNSNSQS
jgi:hypothetical protein